MDPFALSTFTRGQLTTFMSGISNSFFSSHQVRQPHQLTMSPNNATPKKTAASAPVESPPKDLRSHHKARVEQEDLKSISLQSLTYCCYGEYVEVIVSTGDKQKQFMVHKQLLTSHSLFF
jgi:hypothetical protein